MLSKFAAKSAQKSSIFPIKASFERSLFYKKNPILLLYRVAFYKISALFANGN
jgi:hypothetical protein